MPSVNKAFNSKRAIANPRACSVHLVSAALASSLLTSDQSSYNPVNHLPSGCQSFRKEGLSPVRRAGKNNVPSAGGLESRLIIRLPPRFALPPPVHRPARRLCFPSSTDSDCPAQIVGSHTHPAEMDFSQRVEALSGQCHPEVKSHSALELWKSVISKIANVRPPIQMCCLVSAHRSPVIAIVRARGPPPPVLRASAPTSALISARTAAPRPGVTSIAAPASAILIPAVTPTPCSSASA
jgi:hypothetical protein